MKIQENKKGWLIIAVCFLIQMSVYGISINLFQLFIIPVSTALDVSRGTFMVNQSIIFISSMLGSATGWRLYKRWGMLPVIRVTCLVICAAYFSQGLVGHIFLFYLLSAIIGFSSGLSTVVPLSIIIRSWFKENVGTAIGIAFMGTGVGGMIFLPIGNALILARGWASTYRILGIIMAVIAVPLYFFVLKFGPHTESEDPETKSNGEEAATAKHATLSDKLTPTHYLLMLICSLPSIATSTVIFTLNPYLQDLGFGSTFASTVGAISMAALALGKIALGRLIDLKGLVTSIIVIMVVLSSGLLSLSLMSHWLFLIPVMMANFIATPYGTIMLPIIGTEVSTPNTRDKAVSMFTAAGALGSAIGPVFNGISYDVFQSYHPAFYVSIGIILFSGLSMLYLFKKLKVR